MCELICDAIGGCVWSCNTGKDNVYDKIVIERQKKRKIEIKEMCFYTNLHFMDGLEMELTAC